MPNRFTQKTQKAEQKCVFGPSPREPCRAGSAAKTGVPQILRIHQVKTDRSQMHTGRGVIEHLSVTFTLGRRVIDSKWLVNPVDCLVGSTYIGWARRSACWLLPPTGLPTLSLPLDCLYGVVSFYCSSVDLRWPAAYALGDL